MKKPPPPTPDHRDDSNNPVWRLGLPAEVIRMDNSISMTEHMGEFKDKKGRVIGNISRAIGGFVFVIYDVKTGQLLAINFKEAIEKTFDERKRYAAAPIIPNYKFAKKRKRA